MSKYKIIISDSTYEVEIHEDLGNRAKVSVNGVEYEVDIEQMTAPNPTLSAPVAQPTPTQNPTPPPPPPKPNPGQAPLSNTANSGAIRAPMPGVVLDVVVTVGQRVKAGDVVVRVEAMKMENDISSSVDGVVKEIKVEKGAQVQEHDVLIVLGE